LKGEGVFSGSVRTLSIAITAAAVLTFAGAAAGKPIKLLPFRAEFAKHRAQYERAKASHSLVPPPSPCPQNGLLPQPTVGGAVGVVPNCGIPELPIAFGEPYPGTMSYYGGRVQTHPHEYIIFWGWGEKGAFKGSCKSERLVEGTIRATLKCDPDGAGKYTADFIHNIGGTQWAEVQDQYYEADPGGKKFIDQKHNILAGIWVDDHSPGANLQKTRASNSFGPKHTYTDMALEATRAARHFHVHGAALTNANFIIAQPQNFSDPQSASGGALVGYCAFHDYTLYGATNNGAYNPKFGVGQHIVYTNLPYMPNAGGGCGAGFVNHPGALDGISMGLGHEIEEAATDPGAEDVVGNVTTGGTSYYGGWYDTLDANENGDKCAYVGLSPTAGLVGPDILPMPGAMGDIKGRYGGKYAVQALWSNAAAGGAGWCAGVHSTDMPGSLSGEPPY
jgi:serine protease